MKKKGGWGGREDGKEGRMGREEDGKGGREDGVGGRMRMWTVRTCSNRAL